MAKINKMEETTHFALVSQKSDNSYNSPVWDKITSGCNYVKWGADNKAPYLLWDYYLNCSLFQSIVNRIVDYTFGEGPSILDDKIFLSDKNDTIEDVIKKCIIDYILFGGFTLECIRNQKGDIVRYNYLNVMNVRVDEELTTAYISNKWSTYTTTGMKELPLFNKNEMQPHFVYYYRGDITRGINPIPMYASALKSIDILTETRNFHQNNLKNNFSVSCIINLNNGSIKTRELQEIQEKLTTGFTGTDNAGKFILINGGDKDHAATIERLNADNFSDLYVALDESSRNDVYTSFSINPMLLGENVSTGFSKEEFHNAYELFFSTVIKPIQQSIIKEFARVGVDFMITPFKINWEE